MPNAAKKNAIDSRESTRFPTLFSAWCQSGGRILPVIIDNISEQGAHIRFDHPMPIGAMVILMAEDMQVHARIVRSTRDGYGLRFGRKINPLQIVRANILCLRRQHMFAKRQFARDVR